MSAPAAVAGAAELPEQPEQPDTQPATGEQPTSMRWTNLGFSLTSPPTDRAETLEDALVALDKARQSSEEDRAIFKQLRKEVKELTALLKGLPDMESRIAMLSKKHIQLLIKLRQTERPQAAVRQRIALMRSERETALQGLEAAKATRADIEKTCRELQLQNRNVMAEGKRKASEEQQKRKELSQQFQSAIQDVVAKIDQDSQARQKAATDADTLRTKFKEHLTEYESREQNIGSIVENKDAEIQRAQTKLIAQQQSLLKAQQDLEVQQRRHATMLETERDLRQQLASYAEKFEQFQGTLAASNDMFTSFKTEMDKMTKTMKALEKDNISLKSRFEKGARGLAEMTAEQEGQAHVLAAQEGKIGKLEELCRLLQGQRTELLAEVRALEERLAASAHKDAAQ